MFESGLAGQEKLRREFLARAALRRRGRAWAFRIALGPRWAPAFIFPLPACAAGRHLGHSLVATFGRRPPTFAYLAHPLALWRVISPL